MRSICALPNKLCQIQMRNVSGKVVRAIVVLFVLAFERKLELKLELTLQLGLTHELQRQA